MTTTFGAGDARRAVAGGPYGDLGAAARLVQDDLAAAVRRRGEHTALIAGATMTFAELDRASDGLAARLQAAGVQRGDRVAVFADNGIEVVVAVYATLKAGGVFVVVNPATTADGLTHVLTDSGARAAVVHGRLARTALPALQAAGTAVRVWIGAAAGAAESDLAYEDAVATPGRPDDPGLIDADLAALIYTSGSTGRPKGVMLTHRNLTHSAWSIATYLRQTPDDVVACVLPLSFGYGLFQVLVGARVGCTTLIERSFAFPYEVLGRVAEHRVTVLPGVPTLFATLLRLSLDDLDLASLRLFTNAAAALPPAHVARLRELFPAADLVSMYGQTECTRVAYLPAELLDAKPTSVGVAIPNTEAYVVDDHGKRVGHGVVGELVVRGASVMRGYWGDPAATAVRLRDGEVPGEKVLHTGDLFETDEDGLLYFVARTDDVFKCNGEKVSPKEIEQVLYELEAVAEAAVVGLPDEVAGARIAAVVAPVAGAELTPEGVRQHCRRRLPRHLVPALVEVRDALPKTGSGKIRRADLFT